MAIARKERIASPYGEIPETFSFPLNLNEEQKKRILGLSESAVDVWNFFVQEYLYRLDLKKRVKDDTALECEKTLNHKSEMVWDTNISPLSFNYFIKPLRDAFPHIKSCEFDLSRGIARKVVDSFDSYFALRKNNDPHAQKPYFKGDEDFQTLVYLQKTLRAKGAYQGKLVIEKDFVVPIPGATLEKIGNRPIASVEISRTESKRYLPGTFMCSLVVYQPAPEPVLPKRVVGIDLGSSGVGVFDSRGRSFYIKMRRPDYHWRPQIAELDVQITGMRESLKLLPREERAETWRELEQDPLYRSLVEKRKKMFTKMKNQQRDYHKKLVDHLINYGDIFCVGKSIVRSKDGALADASDGDVEKNWNVQNTGALSEIVQLLHWRGKRAGKIVLDTPDIKIDEQDYRTRKVKQAREHLIHGLKMESFKKAYEQHVQLFKKGLVCLLENDLVSTAEIARLTQKSEIITQSFGESHVKSLFGITAKHDVSGYRNVSLRA